MSENIRGITFAEQAVTPADDAIVRRAMLGDGVLTGCEVTYSGSTLTLAPGYIIACGRSFQITTAQNWAVVDATSGVARLLLSIDLTQTATEETFNQISFSIEYAAAEDGFVDLIQEDINLSGTKYQIVCAVVSLGTGGITGIVSKLERTEGGGGGGLNFKVVPGLTQPGTAVENTIWVKTDKIGAWYFSATQPEGMQEWDVWFLVGTSSPAEFNALKKNNVTVYPLSAKQMVSGALKDVTAKSYQNGEWVEWIPEGTLYINGNQCEEITGGWKCNTSLSWSGYTSDGDAGSIAYGEYLTVAAKNGKSYNATTVNKIDLSKYSKLLFDIAPDSSTDDDIVIIHGITSGDLVHHIVASSNSGTLLLTGITGSYYISVVPVNNRTFKVGNIRLVE